MPRFPRPLNLSEALMPREPDEKYVYFLLDVETSKGSLTIAI